MSSGPVSSCCCRCLDSDSDSDLDKNGTWPRANCNCSCRDCQAVSGFHVIFFIFFWVLSSVSRVATGHNKFCGCHAMRTRVACWMDGWMLGSGLSSLVIITPGCLRKEAGKKGAERNSKSARWRDTRKKVVVKNYTTLAHTNGRHTYIYTCGVSATRGTNRNKQKQSASAVCYTLLHRGLP